MDFEPLLAIAIDAEGTKRRENATGVVPRPDGWLLEVSLVDKDAWQADRLEAIRSVGSPEPPRSFDTGEACRAIVLSVVVKADGRWFLEGVRRGMVRLAAAYSVSEARAAMADPTDELARLMDVARVLAPALSQANVADPSHGFAIAMTAASAAAAEFMWRNRQPLVYANHSIELGSQFAIEPSGHEGLNLPVYARFTAPLRRYDDRINLTCLLAAALGEPMPFSTAQMQALIERRGCSVPVPSPSVTDRADAPPKVVDLAALPRAEFHAVLGKAASFGIWPDALQAEFLLRLAAGRLEERDLLQVLVNGTQSAPRVLRVTSISALRGADEGEHLNGTLHAFCERTGRPRPLVDRPEAYPGGYIVTASLDGYIRERGCGAIPRLAQRDAIGRLLARVVGIDPDDAPPDADALIMEPPSQLLNSAMMEQRFCALAWKFETVRGGFRASVGIPGLGQRFQGLGLSKADAKNAAAALALEAIYGKDEDIEAPVPGISRSM